MGFLCFFFKEPKTVSFQKNKYRIKKKQKKTGGLGFETTGFSQP